MTEKELRKLNRAELLEMLIAQSKKLSRVEEELSAAQKELERRKIAITTSGSLAEAALKLNGIFEAADQAAAQYLDSLREQESNAEHIIAEAEAKAHEIINAAEVQRQAILADADREAKRRIELFELALQGFFEHAHLIEEKGPYETRKQSNRYGCALRGRAHRRTQP